MQWESELAANATNGRSTSQSRKQFLKLETSDTKYGQDG
jgi:hypothetical protein